MLAQASGSGGRLLRGFEVQCFAAEKKGDERKGHSTNCIYRDQSSVWPLPQSLSTNPTTFISRFQRDPFEEQLTHAFLMSSAQAMFKVKYQVAPQAKR